MRNFVPNHLPTHRFLATLPVFVDGLEGFLASEKLEFEDDMLSFTETGVEFKSGRVVEHVDEVSLLKREVNLNWSSGHFLYWIPI